MPGWHGTGETGRDSNLPFRHCWDRVLYLSVLVFNLAVTISIGEELLAMTGIFMFTLPLVIVLVLLVRRANRYSRGGVGRAFEDYPYVTVGNGSKR